MTQKTPRKSRYMDSIALAVASGSTIKSAAAEAGCSLPIAYSLSRSPEFRERIGEIRKLAIERAVGLLSDAAGQAATTLVDLLTDDDPKIRLAASSKLLSSITPLTELHDLRHDLQQLREQLSPRLKVAT